MSSFLLYGVVAGFAFGIFSRTLLQFGLPEVIWILVISFVLGLVWRRGGAAPSSLYFLCASIFLLCFGLGALRMEYATWNENNPELQKFVGTTFNGEGVIIREPEARGNMLRLYVASEDEIFLVSTSNAQKLSYGDRVLFTGMLQQPASFETEFGRTFNYPGYLHARDVSYAVSFAEVEIQAEGEGNPFITLLFQFKEAFIVRLEKAIPSPHVDLSEGLLLGVKQALGEKYEEAFQKTGITHIVVLSGYNLMLVTVFVMYVFSFFLPYRLRLVCGLCAITAFALLVGLSSTVLRASIMAGLILIAKLTGRTYDVVRGLLMAGTLMLLFNPYLLVYDVGFQLSFVATLGLILLSPTLEKYFTFMPQAIGLREFLIATVAAQIFVLPILLYQIGQFSVVSIIVNVLVLPMVPLAMLLSFAAGITGFVSFFVSQMFGYAAYWCLSYILGIAVFFGSLPFASFVVPAFSFVFVIGAYGLIIACLFFIRARSFAPQGISELKGWTIVAEETFKEEQSDKTSDPIFFR